MTTQQNQNTDDFVLKNLLEQSFGTKPKNVSKRINGFFLFIVLVFVATALLSDVISGEMMNRIGLALNFLAVFLLTPELIRASELQKFESTIEIFLQSYRVWILQNSKLSYLQKFSIVSGTVLVISYSVILLSPQNSQNELPDYLIFAAPIAIASGLFICMCTVCVYLIAKFLRHALLKVIHDGTLRTTLKWWGLICFIIANVLQFFATF